MRILQVLTAGILLAGTAAFGAHAEGTVPTPSFTGAGINVSDLGRSLAFYENALGMKEVSRHETAKIAEVVLNFGNPGEALLVIVQNKDRTKPYTVGDGFGRLMINVANAKTVADKVRASTGKVEVEPNVAAQPNGTAVTMIRDPDGYAIEVVQNPPEEIRKLLAR